LSITDLINSLIYINFKNVIVCTKGIHWCTEDGCNRSYTVKKSLQRHLKAAHNKYDSKGRFICQVETCEERFFHAKGLKQHYFKQHNIIIGKYDASPYTYDDS